MSAAPASFSPSPSCVAQAPALRVYLVEDSPTIRENLMAALDDLVGTADMGWADGAAQGSAWLTSESSWDLAIVDLALRQGSGFDVLKACSGRDPEQKVVVLSNYATDDVRKRCLALGADAVFDKSTEIDALVDYCLALRDGAA